MRGKAFAKFFLRLLVVFAAAILLFPSRAAAQISPTWSSTPVELPGQGSLNGVSCTWIAFCVAVDAHGNAFTYDGSTWTKTNIDGTTALDSVSCVSPAFCVAGDNSGRVLTFNGTTWSAPQLIDANTPISSVSCVSANFCAAVDGNGDAIVYNGSGWSAPFLLDPVLQGSVQGVSCTSPTFCMAVDQNGKAYTFNGSGWSKPVVVNANAYFYGVSCASPTFCVAVDYNFGAVYTYNTGSWSAPNNIDNHTFPSLLAVSCASPSFCVAVDPYGNALTYNGSSWSTKLIDPASNQLGLQAVSCPSSTFCAAVDFAGNALIYSKAFALGKIVDLPMISPGQQALTYTLAAVNRGASGVTGVTVTDNLPSGASLVSTASTQGSCSGSAIITCSVGSLPAGAASRITIQVTANWVGGTTITNTADAVSLEYPNASDNSSTATTIVNSTGAATTTVLATSVNPSVFGQPVSLTATVTPTASSANIPNGTVTFSDGGTALGSVTPLSNGTATLSTATLAVGNHSLTAVYSGDSNFAASTSAAFAETVSRAGTTTGLAASPNPANVGQAVTLTATVTVVAPGAGTPTGTATFSDNGTPLTCSGGNQTLSAGQATCQYAFAAQGSHPLTASYSGDTNFTGSVTSSPLTVTVQAAPPPMVQVVDNETIRLTDAESFPDVFDPEPVHVTDAVFVTPLINIGAPVADYSAGSLGFGSVAAGQTGVQAITVSDIGQAPLVLSSAAISQGSSAFGISQMTCSNGTASLPTTLPVGGACTFMISYTAPASAPASATLTLTDNAQLSNVASAQAGSSFTQSIALNGSGTSTPPPPPPPAVVPLMDNETITVTDTASFSDVFDAERVTVTDQVTITVLNTSAGSGVSVTPVDTTTGASPVSLTFSQVTQPGATSLTTSSTGPAAPSGFQLGNPGVYYNISTTATFTGPVAICINYAGISFTQPPQLFHYQTGAWVNVTTSVNTTTMVVCGTTTSFSPFALFQQSVFPATTSLNAPGVTYGTAASVTVSVGSSGGPVTGSVSLSVDGGAGSTMPLSGGSATFGLGVLNAGSHSLSASFAAQGSFLASSTTGTLAVARAPLTITANNVSRQYGQANPPLNNATYSGFVNGDGPASLSGALNCSSTATQASPVGAYPIACSGLTSTNYTITFVAGTLTVAPAIVTVTANNATKVLNAVNPPLTSTLSGFVNGDTSSVLTASPTCTTTATTTSPVGSYSIACSRASAVNYTFSYVAGTLKILYATATGHVIQPPINGDGSSVFNQGRTIPAKFAVYDANGVSIGTPGVVSTFFLTAKVSGTVTTTVESVVDTNNPDTSFRWDGQEWIFNITTGNLSAGSTYIYTITLNDGSTIMFQYGLR